MVAVADLRPLALVRALVCLIALFIGGSVAFGQQKQAETPRERLTAAQQRLDRLQNAIATPDIEDTALQKLRSDLDPIRTALITLQNDVAGPRDAARARIDKLGPPPKEGEPPEAVEVAEARKRENAVFAELDAVAREVQLEVTRADQMVNRITALRREAFTRQITERNDSVLDPALWVEVGGALPRIGGILSSILRDSTDHVMANVGWETLLAPVILFVGIWLLRLLRLRLIRARETLSLNREAPPRFVAASYAIGEVFIAALGWPAILIFTTLVLDGFDLLYPRFAEVIVAPMLGSLLVATAIDAVGGGLLSVSKPHLRLAPFSDWAARLIRRRVRIASYISFVSAFLQTIAATIVAPVAVTAALSALLSLAFAVTIGSTLLRLRAAPLTPEEVESGPVANPLDFLRPIFWLVVLLIVVSLLTGFIAFARFLAFLSVFSLFAASFAHILITLIDGGLTDGLAPDQPRGRALSSAVGVSPRNVAFAATILSGLLRFLVLATTALLFVSPLGLFSADIVSTIERVYFGFQVGGITISPSSILQGALLFGLVLLATRLVLGWVRNTLLPRTAMDSGLQNSIATIIGYFGIVLAVVIGLSEVGLDLQNVALVAGALSVGIGFGLQSIVSNFVSGLILLAERPVRVGDIISVKSGEEGYVRRISVRATEIETYDRATLIVPNSELITGVVKNRVYANTWARIHVAVKVGLESDAAAVETAMLAAVADDPRILPTPRPRVLLSTIGDAALEFELVAVLASVETGPTVRSDLNKRIIAAFREAGIRLAGQAVPAAPATVVVTLDETLRALDGARSAAGVPQS